MAPVVRALAEAPGVDSRVCVTGQHRDMLDQVLALFEIEPDDDLALMKPRQSLTELTCRVLTHLAPVIEAHRPDIVLVHGDTTTALASALAAFYAGVPVAHVEAGLRTGDLSRPFPEEANRVLVDRLCALCFAPTGGAAENLRREGVVEDRIAVTGNTVIDALLWMRDRVRAQPLSAWADALGPALGMLEGDSPVVLVTGHRRESFGQGFDDICTALSTLALRHPAVHFVYPVHLNPNVLDVVRTRLSGLPNVHLLRPLSYAPFVALMDRATLVLTDSGGIQEEAPSLGKPVLVMRDTTERPEAVAAGTVILVGTNVDRIVAQTERLLTDEAAYAAMSQAHNPYGDGLASGRIVDALLRWHCG